MLMALLNRDALECPPCNCHRREDMSLEFQRIIDGIEERMNDKN